MAASPDEFPTNPSLEDALDDFRQNTAQHGDLSPLNCLDARENVLTLDKFQELETEAMDREY